MAREIIDLLGLDGVEDAPIENPARLVLPHPRHGGPSLLEIRRRLAGRRYRITATPARVFIDVDPGEPEAPLIALETIARDDAAGLERMLLSVLPYVDEIVLGIDGRSKPDTLEVARRYADEVRVFTAADIGVTDEEWANNKIDFSKARNLGRARVKAPWTLVLDSDEFFVAGKDDIRELVRRADTDPAIASFKVPVVVGGALMEDAHRLARTRFRWERGTHNQLIRDGRAEPIDARIVSDLSLRALDEQQRRTAQRDRGIEEMIDDAAKGDLTAIFHLAKHRTYGSPEDFTAAVKMIEDYRLRIEPHSILSDDRAWLAMGLAFRYYEEDNLDEADRWCCRALLDGPHVVAFCLLGDIAEGQGDLQRALRWYQAACAIDEVGKLHWPGITELRYARLSGIKKAIIDPTTAPRIEDAVFGDA